MRRLGAIPGSCPASFPARAQELPLMCGRTRNHRGLHLDTRLGLWWAADDGSNHQVTRSN